MEPEFLDLIKTFEKTAKRLETLDSSILNFKGVIEGLRQNLDELVEMVQLEEIVELSEKGSQKIQLLNQDLDQVSSTYERLLQMEQVKEDYGKRLSNIEEKVLELYEFSKRNATHQSSYPKKTSYLALEDHQHIYYVEPQTNQLMIQPKDQQADIVTIDQVKVKKLASENGAVFALDQQTGEVLVLNGNQVMMHYDLNATDFVVVGYYIYYLSDTQFMTFNLLTSEKRLVLEHVVSFECLTNQFICYTTNEQTMFIPLEK